MESDTDSPSLVEIARLLDRHRVAFIVIGGQAAILHGSMLASFDVDLCYERTADNLARLATALSEIHPTLRGAPPGLPFRLDAQSLALGSNFTFDTDLGPLDLLGWVEPLGGYDALSDHSEDFDLEDIHVHAIGLDDLIAVKRHLGRPKDRAELAQLEAIRALREP